MLVPDLNLDLTLGRLLALWGALDPELADRRTRRTLETWISVIAQPDPSTRDCAVEDAKSRTASAGAATLQSLPLLSQPKVAVDCAESDAMAASPWLGVGILPIQQLTAKGLSHSDGPRAYG